MTYICDEILSHPVGLPPLRYVTKLAKDPDAMIFRPW